MGVAAVPIMVAGSLFGAYSQYKAGQQAQEIANRNRELSNQTALDNEAIARENMAIANREADAQLESGITAVKYKRKEISRLLAYQRAQEAVSGFRYEGTPINVAEESAKEGEQDVATIWSNALTEADLTRARGRVAALQGTRIAGQMRTQGDIMAQQGGYAATTGMYSGASTLLSGIGNAYMFSQYPSLQPGRMRIGV